MKKVYEEPVVEVLMMQVNSLIAAPLTLSGEGFDNDIGAGSDDDIW